jgi:phosphoglycolate phosphatase
MEGRMPERSLAGTTIVFDLDGTLVDSAPDLARALNVVLPRMGLAEMDAAAARPLIGHGSRNLIERAARAQGQTPGAAELDAAVELFVAAYARDIAGATRAFPGLEPALDALADAGARLSVCTNKRTSLSVQLLSALGLLGRFGAVIGADVAPRPKPHADHFIAAVEAAGGEVGRSLMVGDTAADVLAARGAGAPVVVVSFGYADTAPALLGADAVLDRFEGLPALASRLLAAAAPAADQARPRR